MVQIWRSGSKDLVSLESTDQSATLERVVYPTILKAVSGPGNKQMFDIYWSWEI